MAVLLVSLYHYTYRYETVYDHTIPMWFFPMGESGVLLFFILSGFLIVHSLNRIEHPLDFVIARFPRLFPAYWVAVALTFTSVKLFDLPQREVGWTTALINLTMVQKWFGVEEVDGVYWTLVIELSFYLMVLCILLLRQNRHINWICVVWLTCIYATFILEDGLNVNIGNDLETLFLLEYGHLFISGIFFYRFWQSKNPLYVLPIALCLVPEFVYRPALFLSVLGYYGLFFLFCINRLSWIISPFLVFIGQVSYGFYLVHQNIGYIIIQELYDQHWANFFSVTLVPFLLCLGLATIIYYGVEKPALVYLRKQWLKVKNKYPLLQQGYNKPSS